MFPTSNGRKVKLVALLNNHLSTMKGKSPLLLLLVLVVLSGGVYYYAQQSSLTQSGAATAPRCQPCYDAFKACRANLKVPPTALGQPAVQPATDQYNAAVKACDDALAACLNRMNCSWDATAYNNALRPWERTGPTTEPSPSGMGAGQPVNPVGK